MDPRRSSCGAPSMRGRSSRFPVHASIGRSTARSPSPNKGDAVSSTSMPAAAAPRPTIARCELARRIAGASGASVGIVPRTPRAARSASAPCPSSSSTPTSAPRRMPCSRSIANATSRRDDRRSSRWRVRYASAAMTTPTRIQMVSGSPRGRLSHRARPSSAAPPATSSAVSAAASNTAAAISARLRWRRSRSTSARIVMERAGW